MKQRVRVLFFGDVVGAGGRLAVRQVLPELEKKIDPSVVIANIENTTHGFGINKEHFEELRSLGVDVMTSGNHIWDQKGVDEILNLPSNHIVRPGNFPSLSDMPCPGTGYTFYHFDTETPPLCVINLQGRVLMEPIDCPFQFLDEHLPTLKQRTPMVFVDFHAETTAEKLAFAHFFDGEVSAIVGTHTHVATADAQILPKGTAYVTDVGLCGSHCSVIGMDPVGSIFRVRHRRPQRLTVSDRQPAADVVVIDIDCESGKAIFIERNTHYA